MKKNKQKKRNNWEFIEMSNKNAFNAFKRNSRGLERNVSLPHTCRSIRDSRNDRHPASRRGNRSCRDFYRKSSVTQVQRNLFVRRAAAGRTHNSSEGRKKIHSHETCARRAADRRLSLMTELRCDFSPVVINFNWWTTLRAKRNLRDDRFCAIPVERFRTNGKSVVLANLRATRQFNNDFRIWCVIYHF